MTRTRVRSARSQRGVALLVLAVLLVLGVTWFLVSGLNRMTHPAIDRGDNAEVLAQAKAALIGRMVTDASDSGERNPGRLPCPEAPAYVGTPNEGIAAGNCSAPAIGRLPWRTLGLPKLLDASGEPLWYVVSPGWALPSASATLTINSDSAGNLSVDGQANAAVALVVAPGSPITTAGSAACSARTQLRGVTPLDVCNYLETPLDLTVDLAATPLPTPVFTTAGPAGAFNDQVLKVTAADVIPPLEGAIAARMQRNLAPLLADATRNDGGNVVRVAPVAGYYPFAAAWTTSATSTYSGTIGASQGMLPLVRSRKPCDPLTDPNLAINPCNPTLNTKYCCDSTHTPALCKSTEPIDDHCAFSTAVNWDLSSAIQVTISGGTGGGQIDEVKCGTSSPTTISCTVKYGKNCAAGWCGIVQPVVKITARTTDAAGIAFRRVNDALLSALPGASTFVPNSGQFTWLSSPAGALEVATRWRLPAVDVWWYCDKECGTAAIQIPSIYIEDNIPLQSRLREAPAPSSDDPELRWLLTNNWQQLTYFAVTTRQVPGGSGSCNSANCLSVAGVDALLASQQALLVLAGRALALPGVSIPRAALTDFLEAPNADGDRSFERKTVNMLFNDRIVLVNPLPP